MTELGDVLERLGLLQYLGKLHDEGFERWETVLDITEQDLAALNFKLGHRRILQREIASARGIAATQALTSTQFGPVEETDTEEKSYQKSLKIEVAKVQVSTGKRKYRRHPKPDDNAPEKPPSAYVMFANRVRDELKGQNLSFTDIAKLVGERWKILAPEDKESYEFQASVAKDKYNSEFEEYKKTSHYKEYMRYLADFKLKTNKDGKETVDQPDIIQKRPRLDSIPSTGSTGTLSAGASTASVSSAGSIGGIGMIAQSTGVVKPLGALPGSTSAYSSSLLHKGLSRSPQSCGLQQKPLSISVPSSRPSVAGAQSDSKNNALTMSDTHGALSAVTDSHIFPRIHPAVQSPHMQQQSSYLRHQSRTGIVLPNLGAQRQVLEGFTPLSVTSSVGTSSVPSGTPLPSTLPSIDDTPRNHRSLPPLTSSPIPGYFDHSTYQHRPMSRPQSPRSSKQQQTYTLDHHPRYTTSTPLSSPSTADSNNLPRPRPPTPRSPRPAHKGSPSPPKPAN
ncbi:hypothetical protein EDC01DRAFT_209581 [Geopyxis carbonaria]|nr:hypothetical protein EDC01DRAFT_209581 [Geopyxis carbonaria]